MTDFIINDLHLGVQRTGGTTRASADTLREYAHQQHVRLLQTAARNMCDRIIVNGDLTDAYDISLGQALRLYVDTAGFLRDHPDIEIVWSLGNHDLSKDSAKLGTVAFIGALLEQAFPDQFQLVKEPTALDAATYVIPHVANQDLFDLALDNVPDGVQRLLLHCNYDNEFAVEADHSLNLSRAKAKELRDRGITMILGHEHQHRTLMGGFVVIVGNQFPTSVADCLAHGDAQKDGAKYALLVDGTGPGSIRHVQTWARHEDHGFREIDWRELSSAEGLDGVSFIKVVGKAAVSESADALRAIAAFRQSSQAFVVTNGVQNEQLESLESVARSVEDVRTVNVMELLMEMLDPDQRAAVTKLLENKEKEEA